MSQSNRGGRGGGQGGRGQQNGKPNNDQTKRNNQEREEKQKKSLTRHTGTVRAVSSGDTFSILQVSQDGNTEFQFSLMGLKAPQLGRRGNNQNQNQNQPQKPDEDIKDEVWFTLKNDNLYCVHILIL